MEGTSFNYVQGNIGASLVPGCFSAEVMQAAASKPRCINQLFSDDQ
jgi:F0F1-type ATP synthase membrane subunit c/vacuolar-type H+-ATPase subunit K